MNQKKAEMKQMKNRNKSNEIPNISLKHEATIVYEAQITKQSQIL